ncbi:3',5'-cyclic AMP phosphodiesterase CpdA [Methylomagnum ishizawai]|uniref:3',5'-cyclic AMP phosphodiesterase CpdA n=2 Tax=Methylomagnum ishizawai TaxID=1760988 RepID=A0A1Y6D703_9GAMM|nr:3',5'-cyclic AMP phosphodiesterase CpdA [Methylomagnum ishizawai]
MNTSASDQSIVWLHLSDLHLKDIKSAGVYRTQLETDLLNELNVPRLDYLVISGDIGDYAEKAEYAAAFDLVDGLMKRFGLTHDQLVIVPGNHDLNWKLSEKSYAFIPKSKTPDPLLKEYLPAGEAGSLKRSEPKYQKRFSVFNDHFYKKLLALDYPLQYEEQFAWIEQPEHRLLFVGFNSAWEIDHHYKQRSGINPQALAQAINRLHDGNYAGWLKIAVWHHPVTGPEAMEDAFLQQLTTNGFQVCMHGHIHKAQENFYKYDDARGIHIIGAGTFGAPAKDQVPGIPLQYNLIKFDPYSATLTVYTRKKEEPNGAWSADARWGDKNAPKSWYNFKVPRYKSGDQINHGPGPAPNPGTVCDAIRSEIREAIKKLLGKPALQEVRKALINAQAEPRLDPEAWLVPCGAGPFPIEEKIDTLHDAVRDGLQAVKEGQPHLLKPARDDAKEALERLLVLAVPDAWAQIGTQHLGSGQRKVDIPEKLPLWAEVAQGRVNGNCPQLALKEDGIGVFAPNHLDHDELERGLTHQDALVETLRLIWLKVQKCEPPTDLNWQRQLSKTLVRRAKDGERYHITIPHDRYAAISANPVWAEKLGDTLAHFGIFVYATGVGDPVLIVPEDDLLVAIREYLRLLRKYE